MVNLYRILILRTRTEYQQHAVTDATSDISADIINDVPYLLLSLQSSYFPLDIFGSPDEPRTQHQSAYGSQDSMENLESVLPICAGPFCEVGTINMHKACNHKENPGQSVEDTTGPNYPW